MYTGNVWGIALLIAGFLTALTAFELLLAALFPRRHDAAARTLCARTGASVGVGVAVVAVVAVAVALLSQLGGPGKFAAALVLSAASFLLAGGLAAVSRIVGERMPSPADVGRPWRATLRGGVTCGLAFAVPFVGWFLLTSASIVAGVGAVTLSALSPARAPDAPPTEIGAAA